MPSRSAANLLGLSLPGLFRVCRLSRALDYLTTLSLVCQPFFKTFFEVFFGPFLSQELCGIMSLPPTRLTGSRDSFDIITRPATFVNIFFEIFPFFFFGLSNTQYIVCFCQIDTSLSPFLGANPTAEKNWRGTFPRLLQKIFHRCGAHLLYIKCEKERTCLP